MKSKIRPLVGLILFAFVTMCLASCKHPSQGAADAGLVTFQQFVRNGINKGQITGGYALDSLGIASLKLGSPIQIYFMRLDSITAYHPGEGQNMLYDVHRVVYPILHGDTVVSSEQLELNQNNNQWIIRGFGDNVTIGSYLAYTKGKPFANTSFLVRVPALSVNFIGYQSSNQYHVVYLGAQPFDSITPLSPAILDDAVRWLKPRADALNTAAP